MRSGRCTPRFIVGVRDVLSVLALVNAWIVYMRSGRCTPRFIVGVRDVLSVLFLNRGMFTGYQQTFFFERIVKRVNRTTKFHRHGLYEAINEMFCINREHENR